MNARAPLPPPPSPPREAPKARRWGLLWGSQVVRQVKTFFIGLRFRF